MIRIIPFLVALYLTTAQEFPTDICELPQEIGKCRKYVNKYFYNKTEKSCQTFGWGGCGGNANKFDTVDECESFCKNGTSLKQLRSARKSDDEAPREVFIGTVLDVNEIEREIINFESGFGNWSSQSLKIVNLSDSTANTDAIKVKKGELVLVPTVSLGGGGDSELSNSFNIAAESLLEIDFALYVSGYNSTLIGGVESKYNPSFGVLVEDESSTKRSTVLDLDRLHVPENAWKKFRFSIKNEEEKKLKIIFSMSLGLGAGNVIALDDVEIRWIPMLETEADTIHKNILFSNVSTLILEQDSNIAFHEPNKGTENTTEIATTPSTTTPAQPLFGDLTIETINKTSSENTNKTVIEPVVVDANKTSTNDSTYNVTESPLNSNNTDVNTTTTAYTDNPNIFGPFNTTTEQGRNESSINQEQIAGQNNTGNTNSTNIVFPQNTTENSNSSNIVFPDSNNQTQNSSQTNSGTTESNPGNIPQNQTAKDDKVPEETTVKLPGNVNETETITEKTKMPEPGATTIAPINGTTFNTSDSSAHKSEDNGTQYGYTAEVVLICLVVIFGLLFLLMVVKYYRLRTSIGDYQIQQGARQTYDNPAFNGFGMQDSYRSR